MIIDALSVTPGTIIEAELCIVGAGAAGITIARECIDAPFRVIVLESGGFDFETAEQDLYKGQSIGDPFQDLTASRLRFLGGTTNHWGGWCLPLEAIDFEPRGDEFPHHGWPFSKAQLDPWYKRAQEVCQLGPYDYRPSRWGVSADTVPAPFAGPDFEVRIIQENPLRFGPAYAPDLRRAQQVTVYLHANAVRLKTGAAAVESVDVKTLSGNALTVQARFYVLAAGGIENARLLLVSDQEGGKGLGNTHDLVGRYFMTHLAFSAGTIVPTNPRMNFDFATNDLYVPGKYRVDRILGLSADAMRRLHLPSLILGWYYKFAPVREAIDALGRVAQGKGSSGNTLSDLGQVLANLDRLTDFLAHKALFGEGVPVEALELWCACEQQPNENSRVLLGPERDQLGMPEVIVNWRVLPEDRANAVAILRLLATEIGHAGFGRLNAAWSDADTWPVDLYGNEHHMGTTRMHSDPYLGVVDENCRVHGLANLYVAGSSVFPTGGAANPTLTIVALAVLLADHLKGKLA